jgi:hypothetical protein
MKSKFWLDGTVRMNLISEMAWELQRRGYMPKTDIGWNEFIETYCLKHENKKETAPYYMNLSDKGYVMLKKAVYVEARRLEDVELKMRRETTTHLTPSEKKRLFGGDQSKSEITVMHTIETPFAITMSGEYYAQQFYGLVEMITESGSLQEPCWMAAHGDTQGNWVPKFFVAPTDKECEEHLRYAPLLSAMEANSAQEALSQLARHLDEMFNQEPDDQQEERGNSIPYHARPDEYYWSLDEGDLTDIPF